VSRGSLASLLGLQSLTRVFGLLGGFVHDAAILSNVLLVLGIALGKDVAFARGRALGDEVEIVVAIGIGDGLEGVDARIGDGRRREAVDLVGVIGRLCVDFRTAQAAAERRLALGDAIDDGRVRLLATPVSFSTIEASTTSCSGVSIGRSASRPSQTAASSVAMAVCILSSTDWRVSPGM